MKRIFIIVLLAALSFSFVIILVFIFKAAADGVSLPFSVFVESEEEKVYGFEAVRRLNRLIPVIPIGISTVVMQVLCIRYLIITRKCRGKNIED